MPIFDGEPVNAEVINREKMDRTSDTDTTGKLSLKNSGSAHIASVQDFIHKIKNALGITSEIAVDDNDYSSSNFISDGDNRRVAIGKLDQALKNTADDLAALDAREAANNSNQQIELDNHEGRIQNLESADMTIGGNKTFSGNVVIQGDLETTGSRTRVNSTDLEVEDRLVTINKGGTNASAEGAGIEVERVSGGYGQFLFDSTLASKWKIGIVGSMFEVIVSGVAQSIAGLKTFLGGIATDTIAENTAAAGVTIDGVLIKDGLVDGRDVSADGADLDVIKTGVLYSETLSATVGAGGTATLPTKFFTQYNFQSDGGEKTGAAVFFGAVAPYKDGVEISLVGIHATDILTIPASNIGTAKGLLLNGDCRLTQGSVLKIKWNQSLDMYLEVSRSQLGVGF